MADMTCNEFVKSMKDAGFDFTYVATSGNMVIRGKVSQSGEHTKTMTQTPSSQESRQRIKDMFKGKLS